MLTSPKVSSGVRGRRRAFTPVFCLTAVALIAILTALQAAPPQKPETGRVTVCTWLGNKKAAYTLSIDDGVPKPTPVMAKIFNDNNIKVTWYPMAKRWTNWKLWIEQVKAGHEVGSHTKTHPSLRKLTQAQKIDEIVDSKAVFEREIRKGVPDYECLTFCIPLGYRDADDASIEIIRKHYIASKRAGSGNRGPSPDLYSVGGGGARTATSLEEYNRWVDRTIKAGGWEVETYHGLQGMGGWEATPQNIFEQHVKYVASKRDVLWIDTVAAIAKYIRERDGASLKIITDSQKQIVVELTDKLDDAIYDAPLTLRVKTRPGWTSPLTVTQKDRTTRVEITKENGVSVAYVDAIPDHGPVTIKPPAK